MKRLSLNISLCLITFIGLASVAVMAQAQTLEPCEQRETPPGKPALKRSDTLPASAQNAAETKTDSNQPCEKKTNQIQIEFDGLNAYPSSDVLKVFREKRVTFPEDQIPTEENIKLATDVLKDLLKGRGFMDATVSGSISDPKTVKFVVEEGLRYSVGTVSVSGNKRLTGDELASTMGQCLDHYAEHTKQGYDRDVFEYCHRTLMNFIRGRGYLQARYIEPKIVSSGVSVNITIPIDEGPLYRVGAIKIEGAEAFKEDELKSLLTMSRGQVADGEKIGKWLFEDLRKEYAEKGFIQYTAEPVPTFVDSPKSKDEGVVNFAITIEEGKRFRLQSITFDGESLSPSEMNTVFLVKPGEFYNDTAFAESIERLNNLGRFEPLDRDKDSVFQTDDEEASVAIVLKLKKKGVPSAH